MGVISGLALGAVLAVPGGTDANDLDKLIASIRGGDGESAARLLETPPVREWLKGDAAALSDLCYFSDISAKILARKAPADAPRVAAVLLNLTSDWLATDPGNFQVLRGRFHALLADGRVRKELGLPITGEPFLHAGEGLELMYERAPRDGIYLLAAARAFADGAEISGDKGLELWDRAENLAFRIQEKHPEAWESISCAFDVLLARVRWGAARREKGLNAKLDLAMGYLAESRKAKPDNIMLRGSFNEAVSMVRELGIRRPGMDFDTERFLPCPGLELDVPFSFGWTPLSPGPPQLIQDDPVLGQARFFEFHTYQWGNPYVMPDGSQVKGDSMKDLAGKHFDFAAKQMKKVQTRHPVESGRLKQCPQGWRFEIAGIDEKGAFVRRREWFFKSAMDRRQTYRIAVRESISGMVDDPTFQATLDSIREISK